MQTQPVPSPAFLQRSQWQMIVVNVAAVNGCAVPRLAAHSGNSNSAHDVNFYEPVLYTALQRADLHGTQVLPFCM